MTTWGVQLSTLESRAAEHDQFAGALVTQLADPLKALATRYEELRKLHGDYAAKLEKERDSQYSELRKTKGKYDSVCQEVENRRKKVDGAFDHGKNKARNAFEQHQVEMRNLKVRFTDTICLSPLTDIEYLSHQYQRDKQAERKVLPRICTRTFGREFP
jgi:hypothetical protein